MEDKPEEENESFLSFSSIGDNPMQLIHILNAYDQPGWPFLTPVRIQMQKCNKCPREFCSPINCRRHIRVHRRSLGADKEWHKNRDLLGAFWDKLSLEAAKKVVSFDDVTLEEVPGSSIISSLASFMRNPGYGVFHPYVRAGSALLNIIQSKPGSLPISSQELFAILDNASEGTFLIAGAAGEMQKFMFGGEAGKITETRNLIACTSFLLEQKLVREWVADKDVESLRCQKMLVEEEEEAQRRQAKLLEKKRQKKLRQKEQKAKEQANQESAKLEETIVLRLDSAVSSETTSLMGSPESSSNFLEAPPIGDHPLSLSLSVQPTMVTDVAPQSDFSRDDSDSGQGPFGSEHRQSNVPRWQVQKTDRIRDGLHCGQEPDKVKPAQKHAPPRDLRLRQALNGNKVWTHKSKQEQQAALNHKLKPENNNVVEAVSSETSSLLGSSESSSNFIEAPPTGDYSPSLSLSVQPTIVTDVAPQSDFRNENSDSGQGPFGSERRQSNVPGWQVQKTEMIRDGLHCGQEPDTVKPVQKHASPIDLRPTQALSRNKVWTHKSKQEQQAAPNNKPKPENNNVVEAVSSETTSPLGSSESSSNFIEAPPKGDHSLSLSLSVQPTIVSDVAPQSDLSNESSDSGQGPFGSEHRQSNVPGWQVQKTEMIRDGLHCGQEPEKLKPVQKHASPRDLRPTQALNRNKVWTHKSKQEQQVALNNKPKPENNNVVEAASIQNHQTEQKCEVVIHKPEPEHNNVDEAASTQSCHTEQNCEVVIGSISVTLGDSQREREPPISENSSQVKLWRPVSSYANRGQVEIGEFTVRVRESNERAILSEKGSPCYYDVNANQSRKHEQEQIVGAEEFSISAAKAFLSMRWKEAIAGDHVKLILTPETELVLDSKEAESDYQVTKSPLDSPSRSVLGNAGTQQDS